MHEFMQGVGRRERGRWKTWHRYLGTKDRDGKRERSTHATQRGARGTEGGTTTSDARATTRAGTDGWTDGCQGNAGERPRRRKGPRPNPTHTHVRMANRAISTDEPKHRREDARPTTRPSRTSNVPRLLRSDVPPRVRDDARPPNRPCRFLRITMCRRGSPSSWVRSSDVIGGRRHRSHVGGRDVQAWRLPTCFRGACATSPSRLRVI